MSPGSGRAPGLLIIGPYPPPFGGVSVHVARLAERAAEAGWRVRVASPYRGGPAPDGRAYAVIAGSGGAFVRFLRCAGALWRSSAEVVHFHASGLSRFWALSVLRWLVPNEARVVLTIHSGSWPASRASGVWGWLEGQLLRRFDQVVCVNEIQSAAVRERAGVSVPILVAPAYLAATPGVLRPDVGAVVERVRREGRRVIVSSGYATRLYRYQDILAAVKGVGTGDEGVVILALYGERDAQYLADLGADAREGRLEILMDQTPEEFLALLRQADVYVRASERDGDAVAVREAVAAGTPVVASDAAPRPAGVLRFPVGDVAALTAALGQVFTGAPGPATAAIGDGWPAVLAIYNRLRERYASDGRTDDR